MGDDRKNDGDAGPKGASSGADDAIPEVEAEIVEDPATREGDLLKDAPLEDSDADDVSSSESLKASDAPRSKPRTPGVAIFAIFAVIALAVFAYWFFQGRGGDESVVSEAAAVVLAGEQSPPPAIPESAEEPSIAVIAEDDSSEDNIQESDPINPVAATPAPTEAFPVIEAAPEEEINTENLAANKGDPPAEENTAPRQDEAVIIEDTVSVTDNTEFSAELAQNDALQEAPPSPPTDIPADIPVDVAAELEAPLNDRPEAIPDLETANVEEPSLAEPDMLAAGATEEVERLSSQLNVEREKNAALEAEMAAMRLEFDETMQRREIEAETTFASLRAELETTRRALATRPEEAGAAAAALAQLSDAVEAGGGFSAELDAAAAFVSDDAVIAPLSLHAEEGVPTRREIKAQFGEAARKALAVAGQEQADSAVGRLEARMKSLISVRPASPQPGNSPRAVVSRIEDAVKRDDFSLAISQVSDLPEPAQAELEEWAALARIHEDVKAALDGLNGAVLAQAAR